ncbi:Hypothetical_protein [Hexamita inflata]|uniref:Hypothetical_protein n=1 Tax=Hexamita inflata TaxID=28002 RepID=A0ABP1HLR6_9EUKA
MIRKSIIFEDTIVNQSPQQLNDQLLTKGQLLVTRVEKNQQLSKLYELQNYQNNFFTNKLILSAPPAQQQQEQKPRLLKTGIYDAELDYYSSPQVNNESRVHKVHRIEESEENASDNEHSEQVKQSATKTKNILRRASLQETLEQTRNQSNLLIPQPLKPETDRKLIKHPEVNLNRVEPKQPKLTPVISIREMKQIHRHQNAQVEVQSIEVRSQLQQKYVSKIEKINENTRIMNEQLQEKLNIIKSDLNFRIDLMDTTDDPEYTNITYGFITSFLEAKSFTEPDKILILLQDFKNNSIQCHQLEKLIDLEKYLRGKCYELNNDNNLKRIIADARNQIIVQILVQKPVLDNLSAEIASNKSFEITKRSNLDVQIMKQKTEQILARFQQYVDDDSVLVHYQIIASKQAQSCDQNILVLKQILNDQNTKLAPKFCTDSLELAIKVEEALQLMLSTLCEQKKMRTAEFEQYTVQIRQNILISLYAKPEDLEIYGRDLVRDAQIEINSRTKRFLQIHYKQVEDMVQQIQKNKVVQKYPLRNIQLNYLLKDIYDLDEHTLFTAYSAHLESFAQSQPNEQSTSILSLCIQLLNLIPPIIKKYPSFTSDISKHAHSFFSKLFIPVDIDDQTWFHLTGQRPVSRAPASKPLLNPSPKPLSRVPTEPVLKPLSRSVTGPQIQTPSLETILLMAVDVSDKFTQKLLSYYELKKIEMDYELYQDLKQRIMNAVQEEELFQEELVMLNDVSGAEKLIEKREEDRMKYADVV